MSDIFKIGLSYVEIEKTVGWKKMDESLPTARAAGGVFWQMAYEAQFLYIRMSIYVFSLDKYHRIIARTLEATSHLL